MEIVTSRLKTKGNTPSPKSKKKLISSPKSNQRYSNPADKTFTPCPKVKRKHSHPSLSKMLNGYIFKTLKRKK